MTDYFKNPILKDDEIVHTLRDIVDEELEKPDTQVALFRIILRTFLAGVEYQKNKESRS